jgi:hypothetical protein
VSWVQLDQRSASSVICAELGHLARLGDVPPAELHHLAACGELGPYRKFHDCSQHSRDPADPTSKMVIEHEAMSLRALRAASRRVRTPTDVDHRRFFLLPDERLETERTAAATQRLDKIG